MASFITVRGYHLDLYGHVNNARYLEFLEEARWAKFDQAMNPMDWVEKGLGFVIVNLNINYRQGSTLGDVLRIETNLREIGKRSVGINQDIYRQDNTLVADAKLTFVVLDLHTQKACPLEGELLQAIETIFA
jgi:thioesterase-3